MEISTSLCINFRLCIWAGPQARSVWVNFAVRGASGGLRLAAAYVIELVLWASKKKRTQNFMAKLTQKDASTEFSQLRSYQIFLTYISTRDEENVCISYIMSDSESRSICTAESLISSRDLELLLMVPIQAYIQGLLSTAHMPCYDLWYQAYAAYQHMTVVSKSLWIWFAQFQRSVQRLGRWLVQWNHTFCWTY